MFENLARNTKLVSEILTLAQIFKRSLWADSIWVCFLFVVKYD